MFQQILNLKLNLWLVDFIGALAALVAGVVIFSIYFGVKYVIGQFKERNKKNRRQNN